MNENSPQSNKQNDSEEVDLGQLFNAIGNIFNRFINFISSIFKEIFSVLIYTLKAVVINIKIIVIVMILAGILGYILERSKPDVYSSSMLIRPYFDSKYQFVNNIGYYNALLVNENYEDISNIFEIPKEDASVLLGFEIEPGPETETDKLVQYSNFINSLDSINSNVLSYDDFIENRSIYSGELFQISAFSSERDVFSKLEQGITNSFTNSYSEKRMLKRDSLITIQKNNLIVQLAQVDSLQNIYINVLESESNAKAPEFTIGGEGFSLGKDKSNTREYELLEKEISLRNQLRELQEKKVDEDVFYDVISSFQKIGKKTIKWNQRYSLLFPIIAFVLLCIIYLTRKTVLYVNNYEA